ncbi:MAG: twin-arginine translocation signal domain-containing protein, partial [Lysobacterales bacterium]
MTNAMTDRRQFLTRVLGATAAAVVGGGVLRG